MTVRARTLYMRAWRAKNRAKELARTREWYAQLRLSVLAHYSNGQLICLCCGEDYLPFLTLDHINGGGTKERLATKGRGHHFFRHLKKRGYPAGYRVLCMNCNLRAHTSRQCECDCPKRKIAVA